MRYGLDVRCALSPQDLKISDLCQIFDKLELKSDKYLFIGYPKDTKGYYFYLADEQKVFVSNEAVFLEKEFLGEGTNALKIELDKVQSIEESIQSSKPTELDMIR